MRVSWGCFGTTLKAAKVLSIFTARWEMAKLPLTTTDRHLANVQYLTKLFEKFCA